MHNNHKSCTIYANWEQLICDLLPLLEKHTRVRNKNNISSLVIFHIQCDCSMNFLSTSSCFRNQLRQWWSELYYQNQNDTHQIHNLLLELERIDIERESYFVLYTSTLPVPLPKMEKRLYNSSSKCNSQLALMASHQPL